ncbi:MAG: hypothetical protein JNK64_37545 [Myxococcales bacterium]|nr:hypothetical protein [Myxococcales bacterium]
MVVPLQQPGWQIAAMGLAAAVALLWGLVLGGVVGLALVALATVCGAGAELARRNLRHHEGWAVVVGADALELPMAPVRGRHRERIAYAQIAGLRESPDVLVIQMVPPVPTRWIRARDLVGGDLAALAAAIRARGVGPADKQVGERPRA